MQHLERPDSERAPGNLRPQGRHAFGRKRLPTRASHASPIPPPSSSPPPKTQIWLSAASDRPPFDSNLGKLCILPAIVRGSRPCRRHPHPRSSQRCPLERGKDPAARASSTPSVSCAQRVPLQQTHSCDPSPQRAVDDPLRNTGCSAPRAQRANATNRITTKVTSRKEALTPRKSGPVPSGVRNS